MPKEIEVEEEVAPKNKGGRPRKIDTDLIFGDEIDPKEESRLQEETAIQQMLQREDATTATIVVSRRMNSAQRYAHLTEIGLNDYNREDLANQHGGGQYRCRVRRSDGQFGGTWYFEIDNTRKPQLDQSVAGTPGGIDAVRLVETMAERFNKKDDQSPLVNTLMSKSDEMMKMMIMQQQENTRMMISMMTAILGKPAAQPDSALTQMSTMLLKHSLEQNQNKMEDMINTMTKLKKFTDVEEDDEEEEKGSFLQDIMSAIPAVLKQVFQQPQPQSLPPGASMNGMQPVPAPVPEPPAQGVVERISAALSAIIQQAEAGVPPIEVHNTWEPLIDPQEYTILQDFLRKPDWFENLTAQLPQIAQNRAWFEKLREIIIADKYEEVAEEAPEETDPQPVIGTSLNTARRKKPKAKKD
jgi:hypothetical protein